MLFSHNSFQKKSFRFIRFGTLLFIGLLFVNSALLVNSTHMPVVRASIAPRIELLAIASTTTGLIPNSTTTTTQSLPFSMNGIWEDISDNTCSDCTYLINLQSTSSNGFLLSAWYQTDPNCPAAVGTEMMNVLIGSNGSTLNGAPGYTFMYLCTRASNPIVADCGQPALWSTTYNLTVSQNSISGEYLGQYWTWNTDSNGAISDCSIEYNYSQPFTLTPVYNTTSLSSSAITFQQQSTGPNNPVLGQSSTSTSQRSTATTSNTSTTTTSSKSGPLRIEILVAAAVLIVVIATGIVFLRKRPQG